MWTKIGILVLKAALWCLSAAHRTSTTITDSDEKHLTHSIATAFQSDFGIATAIVRTVPYTVWELRTPSKHMMAADRHRVIRANHQSAWIEDLRTGDFIKTESGIEPVILCRSLGIRTHMYCLQVAASSLSPSNNHLFYANGILSHNTTCAAGYLLWKAMFTPDTTILVAANKFVQAIEVMDRIRYAYENLPDHIRAGVVEYNKSTITFDNGSRIVSRATSTDTGRGLAISLLYLDEFAYVPNNMQKTFFTSIQPTLSTGGACIITSTPKSDEDQFAQIWKGAIDNIDDYGNLRPDGLGRNNFFAIKVPWWEHPDRDETWAATYRAQLGEARFRQEMECVTGDTHVTVRTPDGTVLSLSVRDLATRLGAAT